MDSIEELDEALERVEEASALLKGLRDGSVTIEEVDAATERLAASARSSPEVKYEERVMYRSGKGEGEEYHWFCKRCFAEHLEQDVQACQVCGRSDQLESKRDRRAYLHQKVEHLMREKQNRSERRERWARYQEQKKRAVDEGAIGASRGKPTDFRMWDAWEPDSNSDDDTSTPSKDDPRFAALENDLRERDQRREEARKRGDACKREGNQAFARKEFHKAIEHYTEAIHYKKDAKEYYTNRALAYLHTHQYSKAIDDCTTVIEMAEFLDGSKHRKGDKLLQKAWIRRSTAYRYQRLYRRAMADVDGALACDPSDTAALSLREQVLSDLAAEQREERLKKEIAHTPESRNQPGQLTKLLRQLIDRETLCLKASDIDTVLVAIAGLVVKDEAASIRVRQMGGLDLCVDLLQNFPDSVLNLVDACISQSSNHVMWICQNGFLARAVAMYREWSEMTLKTRSSLGRLMCSASTQKIARVIILEEFEMLHDALICIVRSAIEAKNEQIIEAAGGTFGLLGNLMLEARFVRKMSATNVIADFTAVLTTSSYELKERALGVLANFVREPQVRTKLIKGSIDSFSKALVSCWNQCIRRRRAGETWCSSDAALKAIAVVVNLTVERDALGPLFNAGVLKVARTELESEDCSREMRGRCVRLIARMCKLGDKMMTIDQCEWCIHVLHSCLLDKTLEESMMDILARGLALCSQSMKSFASLVANQNAGAAPILQAIRTQGESPVSQIDAHLSLCIAKFADSEVFDLDELGKATINRLVYMMRKGDDVSQRNAAIACAKLATCPLNLATLRELHAIELFAGIIPKISK